MSVNITYPCRLDKGNGACLKGKDHEGPCSEFCNVLIRCGDMLPCHSYHGNIGIDLVTVATELLRLYDLRFELAEEEKILADGGFVIVGSGQMSPEEFCSRSAALKASLRQYGKNKKTGWIKLREVLQKLMPPKPTGEDASPTRKAS